jgi:hypothetical protein
MTASCRILASLILGALSVPGCAINRDLKDPNAVDRSFGNERSPDYCENAADQIQSKNPNHPDYALMYEVEGESMGGMPFEKRLVNEAFFRLKPIDGGWEIQINSSKNEQPDYSRLATPPYSPKNPRFIATGFGKGAKAALAQKKRSFCFLVDATDYSPAANAVHLLLWPHEGPDAADREKRVSEMAHRTLSKMRLGYGELEILDGRVGGQGIEERIEWLKFHVRLWFPPKILN